MKKVLSLILMALLPMMASVPVHAYDFMFGDLTSMVSNIETGRKKFMNIVEASEDTNIGQIIKVDNVYYEVGENYTMSVTHSVISQSENNLGDVVIHGQIEYNGKNYTVTSIKDAAFDTGSLNYGITSVTIPNTVKIIGNEAFMDEVGLTTITIPSSLMSIGPASFEGCDGLTTIISYLENPFAITDKVFFSPVKDIYSTATLIVPSGTKSVYQSTAGWKKFQNIREYILGDVNIDGEVNNTDTNALVDYIMSEEPKGIYKNLADLNNDDKVNVADVVKLVTILNIQDGLSMDWQTSYSNQVVSSLICTLNNDGDKTIQLTKCELYCNQSLVSSSNFKTTLAPGGSKSRTFNNLSKLSAKTGFSVVWHYTYNGEDYTYRCDLTE
jgi:hypothetical protein